MRFVSVIRHPNHQLRIWRLMPRELMESENDDFQNDMSFFRNSVSSSMGSLQEKKHTTPMILSNLSDVHRWLVKSDNYLLTTNWKKTLGGGRGRWCFLSRFLDLLLALDKEDDDNDFSADVAVADGWWWDTFDQYLLHLFNLLSNFQATNHPVLQITMDLPGFKRCF